MDGGQSADSRITSQTGLPGQPTSVLLPSGQLKPSLGLLSQFNQGHKVLVKLGICQSNDGDAIRITEQRGHCRTRVSWRVFLPQSHLSRTSLDDRRWAGRGWIPHSPYWAGVGTGTHIQG